MNHQTNIALEQANRWRKGTNEFTTPAIPGAALIILVIFFFPLAILLWIIRFSKHRDKSFMRVRDIRMAGHMLLVGGLFLILILARSDVDASYVVPLTVLSLFLLLGAGWMYLWSKMMQKKLDANYYVIEEQVNRHGVRKVTDLVQVTGRPVHRMSEDVKYLASIGLFPGLVLNTSTWTLTEFTRQHSRGSSPSRPYASANGVKTYTTTSTKTTYAGPMEFTNEELEEIGERTRELVDSIFNKMESQSSGKRPAAASEPKGKSASSPPKPTVKYCPGCGAAIQIAPQETKTCGFCGNVVTYNV
ncbi:hypothetical protein [Paenibacillus sp. 1001270B_150601_E10]|uniref:hypothetical protein n=1 Tax=Paenibacillus sp. 1001270B_150601_E10 TaxID=2787079 RepID=UPI00189CF624|nr:hypothetical protein [Paenibacillus sp. 1001270B_150601_E10]